MTDDVKMTKVKHKTVVYQSDSRYLLILVVMLMWLSGIVLATGGWMKALAAVFAPYALYLTMERFCILIGFVQ